MKDGYVIEITVAGELSPVKVDQDDLLHELQAAVDGNIEVVTLSKFNALVVDEAGKLKDLPLNAAATEYMHALRPDMTGDHIVGDALVVKLVPDDIAAYDLLSYVKSTAIPKIRVVINSNGKV